MTGRFKVGIIGCGHIFDAYARLSRVFAPIEIVACVTLSRAAALVKEPSRTMRSKLRS